jgi:lipid II isoglutaminyl synthase (glutamine-hydrolysing)
LEINGALIVGKLTVVGLKAVGLGATALPGKMAIKIDPNLLSVIDQRCKRKIVITGTNGKTTTTNLIYHILTSRYKNVLSNLKGANMEQGIASAFINDTKKEYDWGVFEVDEGSFQNVVNHIKPDFIVITNFFRDQLDRYGEIENTSAVIYEAIKPLDTTLILNADDPMVAKFKELNKNCVYYGLDENELSNKDQKVVETLFCPICSHELDYEYFNYGQLGKYHCPKCGFHNPNYDYSFTNIKAGSDGNLCDINSRGEIFKDIHFNYGGIYNAYNCLAALASSLEAGMDTAPSIERIENFEYHLGRMEVMEFPDKTVKVTLSKNPIGLSEVLNSITLDNRKKALLFILNDNPADGRDISWIWDADLDTIHQIENIKYICCSGRRAEDMALRIKYTNISPDLIRVNDKMRKSIENVLKEDVEIVYLLPTYTAVFRTRDIILSYLKNRNPFLLNIKELVEKLKT